MSIWYYPCGFYTGQEVVAMGDYEVNLGQGMPAPGTRGRFEYQESGCGNRGDITVNWNCNGLERRLWINLSYIERKGMEIKGIVPEPLRNEDGKRICAVCREAIDDDQPMVFSPYENGWVCDDCLQDNYFLCTECGHYHPMDEMNDVYTRGGDTVCVCNGCLENGDRFFYCEDCGDWYDRSYNDPRYVEDHGWVCEDCATEYAACFDCDRLFVEDALEYDDGMYFCPSCMRRRHRESIKSYSYKPIPKFKLKHKSDQFETDESITELLMGAELEVDKGHDPYICADKIQRANEDVYCKRDGSLGDYGIEIVSHPCSLSYHMNELGWDKIIAIAREYGYTSHEARTCGLHIHVGRRQLEMGDFNSDVVAAKVVLCVYRHWDRIVKFSRRTEGQLHWCDKNNIDFDEVYDESCLLDAALETREAGRYQAVNLCNDNTVEFRIFRGSLEYRTIMASFQLVSNICKYCQKHTGYEVMNSQWEDVAYFEDYPELSEYLVSRELAQTSLLDQLPAWEFSQPSHRLNVITDDMLNPRNPWMNEDFISLRDENGLYTNNNNRIENFDVGDYVVAINANSYDSAVGICQIGRVAIVDTRERRLGVVFNSGGFRHGLQGKLKYDTGYWMKPNHLAHLASDQHPVIDLCLRVYDPEETATTCCPDVMAVAF